MHNRKSTENCSKITCQFKSVCGNLQTPKTKIQYPSGEIASYSQYFFHHCTH